MTVLCGDVFDGLQLLPSESVQCCVTSPPYWGLRDYGVEGQLGLEKTPEEYVSKLVEVFREVRRVLKADGTLWLNLGDSYYGSWGNYGGGNRGNGNQREIINGSAVPNPAYDGLEAYRPPTSLKHATLKPKDLVGIPWRVAFALQADGWYLRQDIIWHKPNPMPESVTDRCTKAHEYLFLLSKSERYYYDAEAIREAAISNLKDKRRGDGGLHMKAVREVVSGGPEASHFGIRSDGKRNRRSVWTVTTNPYKGAHFATFPPALIEPCILAGSREGDTVLDPFAGAGTTVLVSQRLNREAIGIELNPAYVDLIHKRLREEVFS